MIMQRRQRQVVRAAIDSGNLLPSARAVLERLGNEGFDAISEELNSGALSPNQEINALRALSLISKEFAPDRKGDLLDHALRLAVSEQLTVRSAAVHMAIWTRQSLRALGKPIPDERIRSAVERALQLGLRDAQVALATGFMRNESPEVDIVELDIVFHTDC